MAKQIDQKVTLDVKDYVKNVKEANTAAQVATDDTSKKLLENSKAFAQNEKQVKTWSQTMQSEFTKFKKSFTDNLATGAKAVTLDAGFKAMHKAAGDAISMAADADEKFAELKSRISGTDDQMQKYRNTINKTAVDTKTNLASMEDAFISLSDSADPAQIQKFMESIGNATLLAHGNQSSVTDFVKKSLTEQGKDFNQENVEGTLTAADMLRRKGRGFQTMESAMGALGGLDQQGIKASGLSEKNIAAMIAGASKSMSAAQATAGIGAILEANKNGIQQGSVLAGVLGASGKDALRGSNGQLDISKIANGGSYQRLMSMGHGDESKAMEIFRSISGMGPEASDALFKMIKNFKDFNSTMVDANADTKKLSTSAEQASDNVKAMYQQMQDKLVIGFEDIFNPLKGPLKSILGGHPVDALGGMSGAIAGSLKGMMEHPMLTGGAVLGTAAGGMLIKSLFGKMLGNGGLGEVAGLAKGVGIGSALKQMGVTPVYVVNAAEIGTGQTMIPSAIKDLLGGGTAGEGAAGTIGKLGRAGKFMKFLGPLLSVAAEGAQTYSEYSQSDSEQSKKDALMRGGAGIAGSLGGMYAGAALGTMVFPGVGTVIGGAVGGAIGSWGAREGAQKVLVEIHSTDGRFDAKPKATDNPRDARTH